MTLNVAYLLSMLEGLVGTVVLSLLTFLFGGALGFIISLARIAPSRLVSTGSYFYVQIMQGIPLLVLMALAFYGPALIGYPEVSPIFAATLALSLYCSAYLGEIWRGCFESVPKAQWEAAECLGISRVQRLLRVILPQAVRISLPPTVGFLVQVVKNTSVASIIVGYSELTYNTKIINNSTFEPFLYFGLAGGLYFLICYPMTRLSRMLERKVNVANR